MPQNKQDNNMSYMSDMASGCYPAMSFGDWSNAPWNEPEEEYIEVCAQFSVFFIDNDGDIESEITEFVTLDNITDGNDHHVWEQVFDAVNKYCEDKYKGQWYDWNNLEYERQ